MRHTKGTYHRLKTYASGKRVRLTLDEGGRIIETKPIAPAKSKAKTARTKTRVRLQRRKRRLRI